jgi:8-oxo-dGTP pyrophosphatase MutT (NUDIX family)
VTEDVFHLGIKGLIRNQAGKIMLLQVNPEHLKDHGHLADADKQYWDLPGGRVEKGSTVTETLQREIAEETGITDISNIQPIGMVLSNIRIPVGEENFGLILGVYSCTIPPDASVTISHEHLAVEWVEPAEAAKRLMIKYPPEFCDLIAKL